MKCLQRHVDRRTLTRVALLAVAYVSTARLGLLLEPVGGFATLVWPPSGIALAVLMVWGYRVWPGVAIGATGANVWVGAPLPVAAVIGAGNTLAALAGTYLLRRVPGFHRSLVRVRDVLALVTLAAMASTTISATIGPLSLLMGDVIAAHDFAGTWWAWWVGDALGILTVAPLLLTLNKPTSLLAPEAAILALLLAGMSLAIFGELGTASRPLGQPLFVAPLLLWAALRFGQPGVARGVFAVSAIAVVGTSLGQGPFAREPLTAALLSLQAFIAMLVITFLFLGAVISERERVSKERAELLVQEQEARAALQEAVRLRDETLAIVSHDLRNPLGTIVLSIEVLDRFLEPERRTLLDRIRSASERMHRLIKDLLDAEAMEAGRLSNEPRVENAIAILGQAVEAFEPAARNKGITLRADVEPGPDPLEILCDRERVHQVLSNLLGNAIAATAEGGWIRIELLASEADVRFAVRDNGRGIPAEHLPHIFERHWRAPGERRTGAGLGLFISTGIVEAQGGRLWAESAKGRGSSFYVTIPRAPGGSP